MCKGYEGCIFCKCFDACKLSDNDDVWLDDNCDEAIERDIENGRIEYYMAWFEYIKDFE